MMVPAYARRILVACLLFASAAAHAGKEFVAQSAREIPVAARADVVVLGGSTGAVAAAVEAAKAGATVFLAAPRPYLGEDVCATGRLWLDAGASLDDPLVAKLFAVGGGAASGTDPRAMHFTYTADMKADAKHPDRKGVMLGDRIPGPANTASVQYGGDPTITCDLGGVKDVASAGAIVFHRPDDFGLGKMTVETSTDGKEWKKAGAAGGDLKAAPSSMADVQVVRPAVPIDGTCRYVRFGITRAPGTERILLGELLLIGPEKKKAGLAVAAPAGPVRPMHVKRVLDEALLEAGVQFLFNCYPAGVLKDADGKPAGIVMANFSGRQAVVAKTIVDAMPRAAVAGMAGAAFAPYPAGPQTFHRVVIGGAVRKGAGIEGRETGLAMPSKKGPQPIIEYALTIDMPDASWPALQEAEQRARDLTFHPKQVDASERLSQVPPDPLKARAAVRDESPSWDTVDVDAFRPAGIDRVYVLGGRAGVSRAAARQLLFPPALVTAGRRIGRAAAASAATVGELIGLRLPGTTPAGSAVAGEVWEISNENRFPVEGGKTVHAEAGRLPVLGTCDVVVIGGGTGGAPAGIGAARSGAKTLVVEWLHGLGGVGTLGMITKYYHGYRKGFTAEVDRGVKAIGAPTWAVGKPEYWRRANREAGAAVWLWSFGYGALVDDGTVTGAVVATPLGRGVVLADVVIDATGKSDIAYAAGADTRYISDKHIGMQGVGLPPIELGADYTNTDYMFADDTDVVDYWQLFVYAREKFKKAYDLGQLVDSRERRRIVGDVTISPMDMMLGRTWRDTVSVHKSNFDSHGFTVHPMFLIRPPDRKGMTVYVPLRALLPQGLENIMVTGLGASAHRDAVPVIRMQPCVQNQGYAAGRVAAAAAEGATTVRGVNLKPIRQHLVETGCLPKDVLKHTDQPPPSIKRVAKAVRSVVKGYADLEVILARPAAALPLLREAYGTAGGETEKRAYAHILGMLGTADGAGTLRRVVDEFGSWDKGWNYRGMGQFGRSISQLDSYVIALGRTGDPAGLDAIMKKVDDLDAEKALSHHRACAMAIEALAPKLPTPERRQAAAALAAVLDKPGMTGHATTTIAESRTKAAAGGRTANAPRNVSLRELILARALYRMGDHDGRGEKILRTYAKDFRGHYSRHANAVLGDD